MGDPFNVDPWSWEEWRTQELGRQASGGVAGPHLAPGRMLGSGGWPSDRPTRRPKGQTVRRCLSQVVSARLVWPREAGLGPGGARAA